MYSYIHRLYFPRGLCVHHNFMFRVLRLVFFLCFFLGHQHGLSTFIALGIFCLLCYNCHCLIKRGKLGANACCFSPFCFFNGPERHSQFRQIHVCRYLMQARLVFYVSFCLFFFIFLLFFESSFFVCARDGMPIFGFVVVCGDFL